MGNLGASPDSRTQELRIALFGPQVTHWTQESLLDLQFELLRKSSLQKL